MSAVKLKPDSPLDDVPDNFAAASIRWRAIDGARRALIKRRESLRMALNLAALGDDADSERAAIAREQAGEFLPLAKSFPRRVEVELEETDFKLAEGAVEHRRQRELFQAACDGETTRVAVALQPRHRAAVEGIAKAVEKLSEAIADERDVRDKLARTAPQASSPLLPDASSDLRIGTLAEWATPASQWARRMRAIGILR